MVNNEIGKNLYLTRYDSLYVLSNASCQHIYVTAADLLALMDYGMQNASKLTQEVDKTRKDFYDARTTQCEM